MKYVLICRRNDVVYEDMLIIVPIRGWSDATEFVGVSQ